MKNWFAVAVLIASMTPRAGAQGQTPAIPRAADGKPDLSGIWQVLNTAAWDIQDHAASLGVPAGQGVVERNEIPYQPSALARKRENFTSRRTADPETKCYEPGVPRITYMPYPFQILQLGRYVVINYEYLNLTRYIYMDKTPRPEPDVIDFFMGASDGRWDGNTLVVDTTNNNDRTWFDRAGNFHSDALHVIERYSLLDADHINYEVTVEDPKVFTRPWKMSMVLYRHREKNFQLLEYECYGFDVEKYYPYPELNK